jgi:hypothetical protein
LIAISVYDKSNIFLLNCEIKNDYEIQKSTFVDIKENSFVQSIDCQFQKCAGNGIQVSNQSKFHATRCQFFKINGNIIRTEGKSQTIFQNIRLKK